MIGLAESLNIREIEKKWQEYWQKNRVFAFDWDNSRRDNVYSIDTPPPHVSGVLHMGHIFGYSQMDMIARFHRMQGKNVYFPVGYDDNGLPSERYVEKKINRRSKDMERSEFVKICDREIRDAEQSIKNLFLRASYSFDFNEEYRTISKMSSKISQASFIDLYRKGLLYREKKPVVWDVIDRTALAQSELEDKDFESQMNYIEFHSADGKKILVMTTRPELLPACVAVMCHPDSYGTPGEKVLITPLGVRVRLIADEKVDKNKGTGFVMCCTFGDQTDIEWWNKYNLPLKPMISVAGMIDMSCFENDSIDRKYMSLDTMDIQNARKKILEFLLEDGAIAREPEKIIHSVRVGERSKFPVEFLVREQWFIKVLDTKSELHRQTDKINWKPEWMKVRLHNWIEGMSMDWCISRQRFFGIPIPVWYSKRDGELGKVLVADIDQLPVDPLSDTPRGYRRDEVRAETDIFDTWATSAVSMQLSAHGLRDDLNFDRDRYEILKIPFNFRAQGHDIIRTWAFYSIIKSYYHSNSIPWQDIMVNGWCLASDGSKMSKSLGNIIDPVKIFDHFGSDAIRYWAAKSSLGVDTSYQESTVRNGQKLITKLFSCAKFVEIHSRNLTDEIKNVINDIENLKIFEPMDLWILEELGTLVEKYNQVFANYEYSRALELLEDFFWNLFCDNYLEIVKIRCYGLESTRYAGKKFDGDKQINIQKSQQSAIGTIYYIFADLLRLFAPFIPISCEEIYSCLFNGDFKARGSIHRRGNCAKMTRLDIPKEIVAVGKGVLEVVADVRKYKSEKNMSMKTRLGKAQIRSPDRLELAREDLENVCGIDNLMIEVYEKYSLNLENF